MQDVAVYCGENTEPLQILCGHNREALVMAARTGLLVKISNHCTHFGKYLFHVSFIIVRLVFLFLVRKLPASHPVPNTPPPPPSFSRKIPGYVKCLLACPISVATN